MSSPEIQTEGPKAVDGDWICTDEECKNVNFARRTHCNRCNKERVGGDSKKKLGTEIGKAAAEKSRGLFSAEDWQCSKCGNVNWARRQTCNMCNAPKFCDVEERTGYGGGYNDRGVVEYKEREDSDGEYDEFGRRKKPREFTIREKVERKRKIEQPKKKPEKNAINEDDDDDDDEDEGDLSKYALFDSDDDEEDDKKATGSNSKRSRSKSKSNDKKLSKNSSSRSRSRSKTKYKSSRRSRTKSRERKYKKRSRSNSWNRSRRRSRSKSNHKSYSKSPRNYKLRRTNSKSNSRSRSTSKGKYKDNRKY